MDVLEAIKTRGSTAHAIEYVAALRWPALALMFVGSTLTCFTLVDLLGLLARRLTDKREPPLQEREISC